MNNIMKHVRRHEPEKISIISTSLKGIAYLK